MHKHSGKVYIWMARRESQKKPALPMPSSLPPSLQSGDKIKFYYLSHPISCICCGIAGKSL
jgi:hypothetical protein